MIARPDGGPEMWGGVECAHVRIGSRVVDQLELTGHAHREDDLQRFARLGIAALRYPILWERVESDGIGRPDWSWTDRRLGMLRRLGIRPILGLLHHGNGPSGTSLIDARFPEKLAAYAGRVAARYPWVDTYTPVNEPLTTARFSGLYGIWYPHGRDGRAFVRILLNQLRGTVLAMREVRRIRPDAQLLQNEDVGTTLATPALRGTAREENERRWLTFDLLCGRVVPGTDRWAHLIALGAGEHELAWFAENPCPPDVLGVDHYVTSDRVLDDRLDRYPVSSHAPGPPPHANVDAVRASAASPPGLEGAMRAAWARYRLPIAAAEVHLGSTREEQLRWLDDAWRTAGALADEGVDVRAVTSWSLLGAYEWNSLLVRRDGFYESGAFDLRDGTPRETAVGALIRDLATEGSGSHPVLDGPGWWTRPTRLRYGPLDIGDGAHVGPAGPTERNAGRPVAILGAQDDDTTDAVARICEGRGLAPIRVPIGAWTDSGMAGLHPWLVVVALPDRVGPAEAAMWREAAAAAIRAASGERSHLLVLSTDAALGVSGSFDETAWGAPSDAWGRTLAEIEREALEEHGSALVVRTGPRFGPWDAPREPVARDALPFDGRIALSYLPDVVNEALDLSVDGVRGAWHLVNGPAVPRDQLDALASQLGLDIASSADRWFERPRATLATIRGQRLPSLANALVRCFGAPEDVLFPEVDEPYAGDLDEDVLVRTVDLRSAPEFMSPADRPSATRSP